MVEAVFGRGAYLVAWGRRHPALAVVASYALAMVVLTWPVARTFGTRVAGSGADLCVALWDMWWFHEAVTHGHQLMTTPYLFYPQGVALNYHSISWTLAAIAFPFRSLLGAVPAYNLMFFAQTLLCATSMYVCARYVVRDRVAAWLAGFIFTFQPARFERSTIQPNLAGTGAVPLVFFGLLKAWREGRPLWSLLSAAALGFVLLTGAHLFIMTCIAVLFIAAWEVASGRFREREFWKTNAVFCAGCVPCVGPWLWTFVRSRSGLSAAATSVPVSGATSDPLSFVLPTRFHPVFGKLVAHTYDVLGHGGSVAYLGLVVLALLAFGFGYRPTRRAALPWVVGLAGFLALSLGSRFRFDGAVYDFALLPYRAVQGLLPIRALRGPNRFNLLGGPFLALGAAWGFVALKEWLGVRQRLALAVLPLVAFEYLRVPFPTTRLAEPRFYRELAKSSERRAIVELPFKRSAKVAMLSQTLHGKPLVGGKVARMPPDAENYIRRSPLLQALARGKRLACEEVPYRAELERLSKDGIGYFVIRERKATDAESRAYRSFFVERPEWADRDTKVYSIDALLARPLPCDPSETDPKPRAD